MGDRITQNRIFCLYFIGYFLFLYCCLFLVYNSFITSMYKINITFPCLIVFKYLNALYKYYIYYLLFIIPINL